MAGSKNRMTSDNRKDARAILKQYGYLLRMVADASAVYTRRNIWLAFIGDVYEPGLQPARNWPSQPDPSCTRIFDRLL